MPKRGEGDRSFGLAELLIRGAARLVPRGRRDDWREEWLAEVGARRRELKRTGRLTPGARTDLALRAAGSIPDALHLRVRELSPATVATELRVAARSLVRRPGFTAVAVGTLALGIGANTALFSVVRTVLLRPLPFEEPDRLVRVWQTKEGESPGRTISYSNARDIGRRMSSLAELAAFDEWRPALGGEGGPSEVVPGATVDWNFFHLLGVEPALGRFFRPEEAGEGREPVAVIGHGLWERRFGEDPGVVDRTLVANGTAYRILGVLPERFESPGLEGSSWGAPEVWRTPAFDAAGFPRSARSWAALARLRDGATLEAAASEAGTVAEALAREFPEANEGRGIGLVPLRDQLLGDADRVLWILLGSVVLVLLVACANVANLMLVRGTERRRELEVRTALGAGGLRLLASAASESLLLALSGTAAGVALAVAVVRGLGGWFEVVLPRAGAVSVDGGALLFAALLMVVTGLAFGAVPAHRALRRAGAGVPGSRTRGGTAGRNESRLRRLLVGGQVAVTVVLLVGAGLLGRSLSALYDVELGMAREGVVTAELHGSPFYDLSMDEATARYRTILDRLESLPEVRAAGAINILPLSGGFSCDGVTRDDLPPPPPGEDRCAEVRTVFPGVFEALEIPLLRGRLVGPDDGPDDPNVAVVSQSMAESFWPGERSLGKRITVHGESAEVVGIVGDVRHFGPAREARPQLYLPAVQDAWGGTSYGFSLVVRGDRDAGDTAVAVRRVLEGVDPDIAVESLRSVGELLDGSVAGARFRTVFLGGFAGVALLLAVVGLGGVVAYSVRQRTREIGVRVALGARPDRVARMVVKEGGAVVAAGAAVGLVGALVSADVLSSMVFGVEVRDPWVVLGAPIVLTALGLLACWLPARRAARVDPVDALRVE